MIEKDSYLTAVNDVLCRGGDERILLSEENGFNKYGCHPYPEKGLIEFSSSTASTISPEAYDHIINMYNLADAATVTDLDSCSSALHAKFLNRLSEHLGVSESQLHVVSSGSDAHRLAAAMVKQGDELCIVTVETSQTGSKVHSALKGAGDTLISVPFFNPNGTIKNSDELNNDFRITLRKLVDQKKKVLLVLTDVTKSGRIVPDADCIAALAEQYAENVKVLVDACQFRLSPQALHTYLSRGFYVALTGSKFYSGPAFSGALITPDNNSYSPKNVCTGLLLRWEAALFEMKAFRNIPSETTTTYISNFTETLFKAIQESSNVELFYMPRTYKRLSDQAWDALPTIFPLALRNQGGYLKPAQVDAVYKGLIRQRVLIGQPVYFGIRENTEVKALRLCLGSRNLVNAIAGGKGHIILGQMHEVLDRLGHFARQV